MLKASYYMEPTALDEQVFAKLVPADHYLRQVKDLIDWCSFRESMRDCYSATMGRGAEDPVRLLKLTYLQFHYRLSDREVILQAQVNVAYRFFLDLSLESALPTSSLLSQFRSRLGSQRFQELFDALVSQGRDQGLIKDRLRVKDATHILANMALPTTLQLVAQARDRLLSSAQGYRPEQVAEERLEVERIRTVSSDLSDAERLAYRLDHLAAIVSWTDHLATELAASKQGSKRDRQRFEGALAVAHKVLGDQADPKAKDRLRSTVDPDARSGKHGDFYDGYLCDLLQDPASELITAIEVLPANADEAANSLALIAAEQQAQGNHIEELSIDGVGWNGAVLAALSDPQGPDLTVYVPPRPRPSDGPYFNPDQFILDEHRSTLTCPGGKQTKTRYRNDKDTGWKYLFKRNQCAGCNLQNACLARLSNYKGRMVIKNDYQAHYDAAWKRADTTRYKQVRACHPRIERKFDEIANKHQGRKTRYRTRQKVKIQYLITAMVVNIKRMVALDRIKAGNLLPQTA